MLYKREVMEDNRTLKEENKKLKELCDDYKTTIIHRNIEINRLNNIIKGFEKDMRETIEFFRDRPEDKISKGYVIDMLDIYCNRLARELKGEDKE